MTRAEDEALKAYPPKMEYSSMIGVALNKKEDANIKLRDAFIKGYEKAISDIAWIVLGEKMRQNDVSIEGVSDAIKNSNVNGIVNAINAIFKELSKK